MKLARAVQGSHDPWAKVPGRTLEGDFWAGDGLILELGAMCACSARESSYV